MVYSTFCLGFHVLIFFLYKVIVVVFCVCCVLDAFLVLGVVLVCSEFDPVVPGGLFWQSICK